MGKHLLTVHGHKIYADDDRGFRGIRFLAYDQDPEATKQMFEQAEKDHEVEFEDNHHRSYALVDGENGEFTVVAKEQEHGWI